MSDSGPPAFWIIGVVFMIAIGICVVCFSCVQGQGQVQAQGGSSDDLVYVSVVDGFDGGGGGDTGGADFAGGGGGDSGGCGGDTGGASGGDSGGGGGDSGGGGGGGGGDSGC